MSDHGCRIDYYLVSDGLLPTVTDCNMYGHQFGSDHCPVFLTLRGVLPKDLPPPVLSSDFRRERQLSMRDFFGNRKGGVTDTSVTNVTISDATVTDVTITDTTVTDMTVTDTTVTDVPVTDTTVTDVPVTDTTVTDTTVTDTTVNTTVDVTDTTVKEIDPNENSKKRKLKNSMEFPKKKGKKRKLGGTGQSKHGKKAKLDPEGCGNTKQISLMSYFSPNPLPIQKKKT